MAECKERRVLEETLDVSGSSQGYYQEGRGDLVAMGHADTMIPGSRIFLLRHAIHAYDIQKGYSRQKTKDTQHDVKK